MTGPNDRPVRMRRGACRACSPRWRSPAAARSAIAPAAEKDDPALRDRAIQPRVAQRGHRNSIPNDPQAYNMRGSVYGEAGRTEQALADFNKAISLDPNYAQAYANRGLVYRQTNQLDLALADYDKALSIDRVLCARLSRPRHRLQPAGPQRAGARRFQQGDRAAARQCRKPITTAACSIRASISTSSPSTISRPRSGLTHAEGRALRCARAQYLAIGDNKSAAERSRPGGADRSAESQGLGQPRARLRAARQKEKAAGSYAKALNINDKYAPAKAGFARVGGQVGQTYQTF